MMAALRTSTYGWTARCCYALLIGVLWFAPPASAGEPPSIEVAVRQVAETFVIEATLIVAAPPELAWDVLTDFDRMHDFVPNLEASRVVHREGNAVVIAQRGAIRFGLIEQPFETERRIELTPRTQMRTTQLSGTMRRLDSTTVFTPVASGTRLDYRVELIPGMSMPDLITRWFLDYEFRMQLDALAQEMARRQAARASPSG